MYKSWTKIRKTGDFFWPLPKKIKFWSILGSRTFLTFSMWLHTWLSSKCHENVHTINWKKRFLIVFFSVSYYNIRIFSEEIFQIIPFFKFLPSFRLKLGTPKTWSDLANFFTKNTNIVARTDKLSKIFFANSYYGHFLTVSWHLEESLVRSRSKNSKKFRILKLNRPKFGGKNTQQLITKASLKHIKVKQNVLNDAFTIPFLPF